MSALEFLVSQISNISNRSSNVLDLVFVNEPNDFSICEDSNTIIEKEQQDPSHKPYEIKVDYSIQSSCNVEVIYCYNSGHYDRLSAQMEDVNFQHEFSVRDLDSAYEFFVRTVKRMIDQNVPTIRVKKYSNRPKWWTSELQHLKNSRDKLFKRKGNGALTLEYERALKDFNELNDRLHHDHLIRVQENIKNDPAAFWKFARINGGIDAYPNQMSYGDKVGRTTNEIVGLFADYFESIYVNDEEPWEFDDVYEVTSDSVDIEVSLFDVENAIQSKWNSGAGPDEIKPLVVKKCSTASVWPIWLLYQKTFEEGKTPAAMKISKIVPVYKRKGDKATIRCAAWFSQQKICCNKLIESVRTGI